MNTWKKILVAGAAALALAGCGGGADTDTLYTMAHSNAEIKEYEQETTLDADQFEGDPNSVYTALGLNEVCEPEEVEQDIWGGTIANCSNIHQADVVRVTIYANAEAANEAIPYMLSMNAPWGAYQAGAMVLYGSEEEIDSAVDLLAD